MPFDYATSGLPDNAQWRVATTMCNNWLNENMSIFGPERIASFMEHQPVAAAKRIMENCPDWSKESVTLVLLGPAKDTFLQSRETLQQGRLLFDDRTMDLLLAMADASHAKDTDMLRDVKRIFMVEGISTMEDQMVNRKKRDAHHATRWKILGSLEETFKGVKGQDPALDVIFEESAKQSRAALSAIDAQPPKKSPKSPGM